MIGEAGEPGPGEFEVEPDGNRELQEQLEQAAPVREMMTQLEKLGIGQDRVLRAAIISQGKEFISAGQKENAQNIINYAATELGHEQKDYAPFFELALTRDMGISYDLLWDKSLTPRSYQEPSFESEMADELRREQIKSLSENLSNEFLGKQCVAGALHALQFLGARIPERFEQEEVKAAAAIEIARSLDPTRWVDRKIEKGYRGEHELQQADNEKWYDIVEFLKPMAEDYVNEVSALGLKFSREDILLHQIAIDTLARRITEMVAHSEDSKQQRFSHYWLNSAVIQFGVLPEDLQRKIVESDGITPETTEKLYNWSFQYKKYLNFPSLDEFEELKTAEPKTAEPVTEEPPQKEMRTARLLREDQERREREGQ